MNEVKKLIDSFPCSKEKEFEFKVLGESTPEVAEVINNAFSDYSLYEWTGKEACRRDPSLDHAKLTFEVADMVTQWSLNMQLPHHNGTIICLIHKATQRIAGVCVLVEETARPAWQHFFLTLSTIVKALWKITKIPSLIWKSGGFRLWKIFDMSDAEHEATYTRATSTGNYKYVFLIHLATHKDFQRKGVGSCLLEAYEHVVDTLYRDRPSYLTTNEHYLVRLYEKHGFQVDRQFQVVDSLGIEDFPRAFVMYRPEHMN